MTTIAYRDGMIAADTGVFSSNGNFLGSTDKIIASPTNDVAGACGGHAFCGEFLAWVQDGFKGPAPTPGQSDGGVDSGILIRKPGLIEILEPGGWAVLECEYYALGSGRAEALGAMFAGANAQDAVRAALMHDVYSRGGPSFICVKRLQNAARRQETAS